MNKSELTWRFNFNTINQKEINIFIDDFVDFVESENLYCGGLTYMGMYDVTERVPKEDIKTKLLFFLKEKRSIVKSITITSLDENDEFIDGEEILI